MDNEPYRDLSHHEARDLVAHIWPGTVKRAIVESRLPNGKIADVILWLPDNTVIIVEAKTVLRDSLVAIAWEKYGIWCNQLYVGVPDLKIGNLADVPYLLEWTDETHKVGILGIYRDSMAVIRPAKNRPMTAENRRTLDYYLRVP